MGDENFSTGAQRDIWSVALGEWVGEGIGRRVWTLGTDRSKVIKVEDKSESFQNIIEWEVWRHVRDTKLAKWFAPCHMISSSGCILIQTKTFPIKTLPRRVPAFFSDLKPENWGELDGRPVAHDYGYNKLLALGLTGRMKRSDR